MKVSYLEMELHPIGFLPKESLNGIADRVKELLTRDHAREDKLSYWQIIFLQSKANGGLYRGEDLSQSHWEWPKNTWLQERLSHHLKISNLRHSEAMPKHVRGRGGTKENSSQGIYLWSAAELSNLQSRIGLICKTEKPSQKMPLPPCLYRDAAVAAADKKSTFDTLSSHGITVADY